MRGQEVHAALGVRCLQQFEAQAGWVPMYDTDH